MWWSATHVAQLAERPQTGMWLLVHALLGMKLSCQLRGAPHMWAAASWRQQVLDGTIKAACASLHPGPLLTHSGLPVVRGPVHSAKSGKHTR